jgi:hypothetical protein
MRTTRGTAAPHPWYAGAIAVGGVCLALLATPASARSDADQRAAKRVAAMANFLAKAKRLSVTADCTYDVVQDTGAKIEFGERRVMMVQRPDRAQIDVTRRDGTHRGLVFDGKQLAVFDVEQKVYATAAAPDTIDAAFAYFKKDLDMRLPLSELLASDLPKNIEDMVDGARLVAEETINGVATDHVALRGDTADVQLWIARAGDPLPQRLVITYRFADGQPQYAASFIEWSFAPEFPDGAFVFTPAADAREIPFLVPRPARQP